MRVLQVHAFNGVAELYAKGLIRRGHTVHIYKPSLVGADKPFPLKAALLPGRLLDLRHVLGELDPAHHDLVHIHWASYGLLGLFSRVPFVLHCRGSDVRERLRSPLFRSTLAPFFRRAAAVLCITPDLLPVVRRLAPEATFFPAPIDTACFAPPERAERPWTVLLFTRLEPGKGVELAVEGIARFAARHPEVRVWLLDYGVLRRTYRRRYGGRFEFLPHVPPEKVHSLLCQTDVVVGQFAVGALGLSELQAMSCARPLIASYRYPEAYAEPPPLCQADSAAEVAAQLERLYCAPEEAKMLGEHARAWVIARHDYTLLAARLETLYRSCLSP